MNRNIAIDGPAGAGKSTIAKELAGRLGHIYIDTGAMYRAMAIYYLEHGIGPDEEEKIAAACPDIDVTIAFSGGEQRVLLGGRDVTGMLRTEEVGNMASAVSVYAPVRQKLVSLQQALAAERPVVMDGRDIGTVVLPDAAVKIFLTATPEERARRRVLQLEEKGETPDFAAVLEDIRERDYRDTNRENSPLRRADDAVELDTTELTLAEVIDRAMRLCRERFGDED